VNSWFGAKARSMTNTPPAYNDGLSQAITLVVAPLLFGLLGAWIDAALGTGRIFTIGLAVFGLVGVALSTYYRYLDRSAKLDEGKPWTRRAR
jgi:hypothetical protein